MNQWTPATTGALELSPILSPAAHKDQVVVLSNLAHAQAGPQGRATTAATHALPGGVPERRAPEAHRRRRHSGWRHDRPDGAAQIGQDTLLPSLELAVEDYSGLVGSCDVGFSCTYMNTISWRTPTSPLPMEINPRVVFDRMFGDAHRKRAPGAHRDAAQHPRRDHRAGAAAAGRSWREGSQPGGRIPRRGPRDRAPHPDFRASASNPSLAVPESPTGIPDDHEAHTKLMFDLMAIAYQADITRISTFMMAREVSYRTFPKLDLEAFHPASHHQNSPARLETLAKINAFHVSQVAHLLDRLKSTPDGDGNAARLADPLRQRHEQQQHPLDHPPLPVLIAGGAAAAEGRASPDVSKARRCRTSC